MNEQTTTARTALKWGLILAVASILYSAIMFLTDNIGNRGLGLVAYLISIVGLVLAMRDYKSLKGGYMTYGEGLSIGTLTAAISGFLNSLFSVFYMSVIDTGIMTRMADKAREQMENEGKLSDEQIDQGIAIMEKFQSPGFLFVFGLFGAILLGFIFSLIIAAFIRRNKENPFD